MIAGARNEGIYTPPTTQGTMVYPFTGGGVNWGGLAFDAGAQVVFVNTSQRRCTWCTLIPADKVEAMRKADPHEEISPQSRRALRHEARDSALAARPALQPAALGQAARRRHARRARSLWQVPLGTTRDLAPVQPYTRARPARPISAARSSTAGGLVFIGAAMDNYLRAFDAETGKELWKGRLPAGGQATPMTYVWKGRQYVVIAAGGQDDLGTKHGDQLIAFALPN